jgi:hypothetical protein
MVAPLETVGNKRGITRRGGGNSGDGKNDETKGDEIAPRKIDDDKDFLELIHDEGMKPGITFIVNVLNHSGWRSGLIKRWFLEQTKVTSRIRLKAAAIFGSWCKTKGITPNEIACDRSPEKWLEECIQYIYNAGGSFTTADTCRTGVSALFRDWFGINGVGNSGLVRQTLWTKADTRKPQGKRDKIWDIGILMKAVKAEGREEVLKKLPWKTLIGRTGMMLMIYTCCRLTDMLNIIMNKSVWRREDGSMLITMKTKEGRGRLKYKVVLPTEDPDVDPVITIGMYIRQRGEKTKEDEPFFVDEMGNQVCSSEKLSRSYLAPYIHMKGVPMHYTPYSTKTAVITALFNRGYSLDQISAHTGHSTNSSTALKHYHDPTNVWLGHIIAQTAASQNVEVEFDKIGGKVLDDALELEEEHEVKGSVQHVKKKV